ncbi:hypothetical protein QE152_g30704 [Popillia japonica]|uniref:Uncharacterized protein n=1 Tax=Popillia japonica TaxID=7064 RepID=A0AAW1JDT8_POPJA
MNEKKQIARFHMKRPLTHEELLLVIESDEFSQLELDKNQETDVESDNEEEEENPDLLETEVFRLIGRHEQEIIEEHVDNEQEHLENVGDNLEEVEVPEIADVRCPCREGTRLEVGQGC